MIDRRESERNKTPQDEEEEGREAEDSGGQRENAKQGQKEEKDWVTKERLEEQERGRI